MEIFSLVCCDYAAENCLLDYKYHYIADKDICGNHTGVGVAGGASQPI